MREVQLIALLTGAVLVVLGVGTLVAGGGFAEFLAGVFLVLLGLPCLALGGAVTVTRRALHGIRRVRAEWTEERVERYLHTFPRSHFDALRDDLDLRDEELTRALERLLEERRIVEDFDTDREAFVYAPRAPDVTDVEVPTTAPPPDAPPGLVSVRERARRRSGGRA